MHRLFIVCLIAVFCCTLFSCKSSQPAPQEPVVDVTPQPMPEPVKPKEEPVLNVLEPRIDNAPEPVKPKEPDPALSMVNEPAPKTTQPKDPMMPMEMRPKDPDAAEMSVLNVKDDKHEHDHHHPDKTEPSPTVTPEAKTETPTTAPASSTPLRMLVAGQEVALDGKDHELTGDTVFEFVAASGSFIYQFERQGGPMNTTGQVKEKVNMTLGDLKKSTHWVFVISDKELDEIGQQEAATRLAQNADLAAFPDGDSGEADFDFGEESKPAAAQKVVWNVFVSDAEAKQVKCVAKVQVK